MASDSADQVLNPNKHSCSTLYSTFAFFFVLASDSVHWFLFGSHQCPSYSHHPMGCTVVVHRGEAIQCATPSNLILHNFLFLNHFLKFRGTELLKTHNPLNQQQYRTTSSDIQLHTLTRSVYSILLIE